MLIASIEILPVQFSRSPVPVCPFARALPGSPQAQNNQGPSPYLHEATIYCMVPTLKTTMASLQKFIEPFQAVLGMGAPKTQAPKIDPIVVPEGFAYQEKFPLGFHVYAFAKGPDHAGQIMLGAGNPSTAQGCVFLQKDHGAWEQIDLPAETSLVHCFVQLKDGSWIAGGMNSIGRGGCSKGVRMQENGHLLI